MMVDNDNHGLEMGELLMMKLAEHYPFPDHQRTANIRTRIKQTTRNNVSVKENNGREVMTNHLVLLQYHFFLLVGSSCVIENEPNLV